MLITSSWAPARATYGPIHVTLASAGVVDRCLVVGAGAAASRELADNLRPQARQEARSDVAQGWGQQVQGSQVTSAGPDCAIEAWNGFCVVVQNVRFGIEHDTEWLFETLKIRDQDFDATPRSEQANLANRFGKDFCATNIVVVTIDAGYNGMFDPEGRDRLGHTGGLFIIDRLRLSLGYSTETAAPGADVAQQHESGRLVIPAFAYIRTLSGFTHGV